MKINTTRFGEVEVDENHIFCFVNPIIGYDQYQKYLLMEHDKNSCFKWLQSLDEPDLAFPVTSTTFFDIEYNFEIQEDSASKIGLEKVEDLLVLNIAAIPSNNPKNTTINLRAPVIINLANFKAMQLILPDESLQFKYPIFKKIAPKEPMKEG
ncbi:MAG: flagellar assembly protein FliW [Candidatus Gastranaerophilales bacterium]|nr:flagellar assembly protein FliW [Candidatus Gastranaerophilales bacterium]